MAELFKTGRVPNCPEGTMRALLADLLNCAPMRSRKNSLVKGPSASAPTSGVVRTSTRRRRAQTYGQGVRLGRGMSHLKMSLAHGSGLITPVAAKEQKRALPGQQQQGQHSADLAWRMPRHNDKRTDSASTPCGASRRPITSRACLHSAQAMYAQYYQRYPAHYYQAGSGTPRAARLRPRRGGRRGGSCGSSCGR